MSIHRSFCSIFGSRTRAQRFIGAAKMPTPTPCDFGWDEIVGLVNAGAVVFAAFVGAWGVKNWKVERAETRQFELAEEALALMYRAQEVFDYVRSPGSFSNEGQSRVPQDPNETEEEKRTRDYNFVPLERLNNEQEYFKRVIDIRPGIKAMFGEEKSEPLDKILELRHEIIVAARMLSYTRMPNHFRTDEQYQRHLERQENFEAVIWKGYATAIDENGSDPIDSQLATAKEDLLQTVGSVINKRLHSS